MKIAKRFAAALLVGAMFLTTACTKNKPNQPDASGTQQNATKGKYVQTDITPDGLEERVYLFPQDGEKLIAFNEDFTKQYASSDGGKNWTESEGIGTKVAELENIYFASMTPSGSIIAVVPTDENNPDITNVLKIDSDGTVTDVTPTSYAEKQEEYLNSYITSIDALDDETILMSFMYDNNNYFSEENAEDEAETGESEAAPADESEPAPPDGEEEENNNNYENNTEVGLYSLATKEAVQEIESNGVLQAFMKDKQIYIADYNQQIKVYEYDGTLVETLEIPFEQDMSNLFSLFAINEKQELLQVSTKNLQLAGKDGKIATVMDGIAYAFGATNYSINHLIPLENDSYIISLESETLNKIYRYDFDENAVSDPSKTFKVWSLTDSPIMRTSINNYLSQNSDSTIEYEVAMTEEGGITAEDAIRTLNTQLLAGDGPDVIMLDGLPIDSYIAKGLLSDISKISTSDMHANIKDAFKNDKGTYAYATRVAIPMFVGETKDIKDFKSFVAYATSGNELPKTVEGMYDELPKEKQVNLVFDNANELFDLLLDANYNTMIDKDGLNKDTTKTFLNAYKDIATKNYFDKADHSNGLSMGMFSFGDSSEPTSIGGSASGYDFGQAKSGAFIGSDLHTLFMLQQKSNFAFTNLPGLEQNMFIPKVVVGINAQSKAQEQASHFIEFMLSNEMQSVRSAAGFSVTKAGSDGQIAKLTQMLEKQGEKPLTFKIDELISKTEKASIVDEQVRSIFFNTAQEFVQGEKSVDDTINSLEQQLKNYLAERQ